MSATLNWRGDYPYILVRGKDGRKTVSLGKVSEKAARAALYHVERLAESAQFGTTLAADTAAWLDRIPERLHRKLEACGLARDRGKGLTRVTREVPITLAPLGENLCHFPCGLMAPPCVYFLLSLGEVVYVGQTTNLLQRVADHYNGGRGKVFDAIYYIPLSTEHLTRIERAFIAKLSPVLNSSRPFIEPGVADLICKLFESNK